MIDIVNKPENCPYLKRDYDGYPDGCKYDETNCLNDKEFPKDCPLKMGSITVTKQKE